MNWKAKAYIALVIMAGFACLAEVPLYWECNDNLRFVVFTALALVTSAWKISLPGVNGTMSANFLFVLVGTSQLSPSETLVMTVMAVLAQYLYRHNARGWDMLVQLGFNVCSVAVAVRITTLTYTEITPIFPVIEFPFRLALTAIVYFLFNTFPVSIIIALSEKKSLLTTWRNCFFWSFPYYLIGAAISGLLWVVKMAAGWQAAVLLVPLVYIIHRSYRNYLERLAAEKTQAELERNHAEEMAGLHLRTIEALALAIEAKDQTTHDHLQRVQVYCTDVGRELGMSEIELRALLAASLLHDIGKLAVPAHIISKPGKLTPEEFEKMKIHPVVGAEILESVRFPYPVVPIVRSHHEKYDGSGYPDGLRGDEIPLGARILSAVDCFDALSSDRQYRRALPVEESMAYLVKEAGKSFDPKVVEVLSAKYKQLEVKAKNHSANERAKLSVDIKVARGNAPAAGFEEEGSTAKSERSEFVQSIAAARAEGQLLFAISQDLMQSFDLSTMFVRLAEKLKTAVPFETFAYYHAEGDALNPLFVQGKEQELFSTLKVPLGQGLSGWVVMEKKTILNGNPAVEPGFLGDTSAVTVMRSALSVPVEGESGVIGALTLYSLTKDQYTQDHLRLLMSVATRLAFQIENLLRLEKASGDAYTDSLTGMFNSRWLVGHLNSACESARITQQPFALIVIDLDGFKLLNDTAGHLRGNDALRGISVRARELLPLEGSIARMGGDEFVVILTNSNADRAVRVAEQLQQAIEEVGGTIHAGVALSASWGVSLFGVDGLNPDGLMSEADRRMYENKKLKKHRLASQLSNLAIGIQESGFASRSVEGSVSTAPRC